MLTMLSFTALRLDTFYYRVIDTRFRVITFRTHKQKLSFQKIVHIFCFRDKIVIIYYQSFTDFQPSCQLSLLLFTLCCLCIFEIFIQFVQFLIENVKLNHQTGRRLSLMDIKSFKNSIHFSGHAGDSFPDDDCDIFQLHRNKQHPLNITRSKLYTHLRVALKHPTITSVYVLRAEFHWLCVLLWLKT